MKAVVAQGYGPTDVLKVMDVPMPEVRDDEVRITLQFSGVSQADAMMRKGTPKFARLFLGLSKPKNAIPGTSFAGIIEAVGQNVTQFQVGDAVYGETSVSFGAHAQWLCVKADGLIRKLPANLELENVATLCDGPLTAYNFLTELAHLSSEQSIVINGASGSIGSAAVQIAKSFGAHVTAVCSSANVQWVKSLRADVVVDYQTQDFTQLNTSYDVIFDTVGKRNFAQCKSALKSHGQYLSPVLTLPLLFNMLFSHFFSNKKAKFTPTGLSPIPKLHQQLAAIEILMQNQQLKMNIDRRYSLNDIQAAHEYVDSERKKGVVLLTINP
ncbi:MAG: NAD(P)-dependent alcohol dehydrogenase [Gammaproteobacteria bacterium]|nr:NAD(P)-dependent alcohol dehydrogenase [Gammaproteobacteria bacterium]